MSDSILTSVKQKMGLSEGIESFDAEIIMLINAELATLNQLGVGPEEGLQIEGKEETWSLLYTNPKLNFIPSYIALRIWPTFDPTLSHSFVESIKSKAEELEWRLNVAQEWLTEE